MSNATATTSTPSATPERPRTVATPDGRAAVLAEVHVPVAARPAERLVAQALAGPDGPLVRVGYARDGRVVRGPVTATPGELADLVAIVAGHPAFASALAGA